MTLALPCCLCRTLLDQFIKTPSHWSLATLIDYFSSPLPAAVPLSWSKEDSFLDAPFPNLPPIPADSTLFGYKSLLCYGWGHIQSLAPIFGPSAEVFIAMAVVPLKQRLPHPLKYLDKLWVLVGGHRRWPGAHAPRTRLKSILKSSHAGFHGLYTSLSISN